MVLFVFFLAMVCSLEGSVEEGPLGDTNRISITDSLAGRIRQLHDGNPVDLAQLDDHVERLALGAIADSLEVIGEIGADTEAATDLALAVFVEVNGSRNVQTVTEHDGLGGWVDAKLLVVGNNLVHENLGITAVVTHTIPRLRMEEREVTKESLKRLS